MFENSVVESKKSPVSARRWSILPLSVTLHLLAIGGAIFATVWDVELPANPPAQIAAFVLDTAPPLPPPAPQIRRGNPEPKETPTRDPLPEHPVAPVSVPDETPASSETPGAGAPDGAALGDPAGDPNGVPWGEPGGVTDDLTPPAPTPDIPLRVGHDVKAPVVTRRVDPAYPPLALRIGLRGSVTVECVIDRDGVVRDAKLVQSTHPLLNDSVLDAVRQWRFRPGTRNGEAVSTIFQLTVRFDLR